MKNTDWKAGLLLVAGLAFALLGQFYFVYRQKYVWDAILFWCIAFLSFGLLLWRVGGRGLHRQTDRSLSWDRSRLLRGLGIVGGAWLVLLAGRMARRRPEMAGFSDLLWLWLIGVVWFLLAFAPSFSVREAWLCLLHWLRDQRIELAVLAVLLLVALAVRIVDLEHIPANLGGDEGTQGAAALELWMPPLGNPFSTGWLSVPTMSFLAYGLAMRVFGETVAGLRALSTLTGVVTVLVTFLLARELWDRRVAWLAAAVLACSHFHVHFSRLGSNQIIDGLLVTLALWLFVLGLRSRRSYHFALAGVVMGLGWYGYFGARLIGIIMAVYLVGWMIAERRFLAWQHWRLLLILLGAALVVVVPLMFHYSDYPDALAARTQQVSILASGWLAREQEITGLSAASLLLRQCWKSISAFHYTLDPTFWYRSSIPLLDFVSGVLFTLGMAWTAAHCRRSANSLLLLWFWLALILGWVLTENPPSSQRLVIVSPALALLVALGLNWLVELGQRVLDGGRRLWNGVSVVFLVAVAALNLHYYFVTYTPTRVYGNPTAEVATELARYLTQRDDDYIVYFHAPPMMYWGHGTLRFMARGVEGVDVPMPGEEESSESDRPAEHSWQSPARGARFVFLPQRMDELDAVRAQYPGGVKMSVHSNADGRLLYVLYEVDR